MPKAPPPMPAAARKHTVAGAQAFTLWYFDLFTYAEDTGDTKPPEGQSSPDCTACTAMVQETRRTAGRYRYFEPTGRATLLPGARWSGSYVDVPYESVVLASRYLDMHSGQILTNKPKEPQQSHAEIYWSDGAWYVGEFTE